MELLMAFVMPVIQPSMNNAGSLDYDRNVSLEPVVRSNLSSSDLAGHSCVA
jgi:hypothetical protein